MSSTPQNMPAVHQFLWIDYGLPRFKQVIMTVTTMQGVACFGLFAALLGFTQPRCWILIRSFLARILRPIQIAPGPHDLEHLQTISQVEAVKALFGKRKRQDNLSMITIP